jgi:N-acetylmuramoyl-L-alanine amidase
MPEDINSAIESSKLFKYNLIILHHTADMVDSNKDGLYGEEIDRMQRAGERKGYPKFVNGMGYHFLINPNGIIQIGDRWINQIYGAHCVGYNHSAIGICMVGNFDKTLPLPEQINSLGELLCFLDPVDVVPHRKIKNTDCPGTRISQIFWYANIQPLIRVAKT